MRVGHLLGACAALVIITSAAQPRAEAAVTSGGTTIGPVQISPLGHPRLCWQAGGNGSGVTLERCDRALQGQQWSLTPNGVVMNGNGYCLEAVPGGPLLIDFASQCAGSPTQLWHYRSGHLTSPVAALARPAATSPAPAGASAGVTAGTCAAAGAPLSPGTELVGAACSSGSATAAVSRWSIGRSAVTLTPGRGRGPADGTFAASVTVANAASAQAAYGVRVTFALPPGVSAATLRTTDTPASPKSASPGSGPGGPSLRCHVATLTCTGTVPAGASRQITLTGPVPAAARPRDSYPLDAHAKVTGTNQRSRHARTTASLTITVGPAAPHPRSPLVLFAAIAALLLASGTLLILITRRRKSSPRPLNPSCRRAPTPPAVSVPPHP